MTREYKPGDLCEYSGIYQVQHDNNHAAPHEITVIFEENFPPCNRCRQPKFILVHAAIHFRSHAAFKT